MRVTDLVPLVASTGEVWATRCRAAGIAFSLDSGNSAVGPVPAAVDAQRLRQVLDGLLDNAVRVTPAGQPVVLSLSQDNDGAVIEVRDGGPGFAPDDFAVAFERGVLHSRYAGAGPADPASGSRGIRIGHPDGRNGRGRSRTRGRRPVRAPFPPVIRRRSQCLRQL